MPLNDERLHGQGKRQTVAVWAMCVCCALVPSCSDLLRPFSHSTAALCGYVFDSGSTEPVDAAVVRLDGHSDSVMTDADGIFRIQNALTGPAVITVICPGYDTFQKTVDITLHPAADTFFLTSETERPSFSLIRPPDDGFISNEWGYLEIIINDPDTNFSHVKVNWGDGGDPSSSKLLHSEHWHRYVVETDSLMVVTISLFDTTGFSKDTVLKIPVDVVTPPLLDGKLFYEPSQYLAPYDTAVIIGVRILQIEGWATEIVWIINEHDPEACLIARMKYNDRTGAIGPIGNVFISRFSLATLKGTNDIQIIVSDRYGNQSSVFGSFYIAGRP